MKNKYNIEDFKNMKMTDQEKESVWNGVLRRVTDYPEGEYPFDDMPNTWDGILRRKSDFPHGNVPETALRQKEEGNINS